MSNFLESRFDWNDERIGALRTMWAAGQSASAIAGELGGGITRSAVLGKVHRLGLSGATKTFLSSRTAVKNPIALRPAGIARPRLEPRAAPRPRAKPEMAVVDRAAGAEPIIDLPPEQSPFAVRLLDHHEGQCRWPIGDPSGPDFFFCGAAIVGPVYCARHHRLAHNRNPAPSRAELELNFRATVRRGRIEADMLNVTTNQEIA